MPSFVDLIVPHSNLVSQMNIVSRIVFNTCAELSVWFLIAMLSCRKKKTVDMKSASTTKLLKMAREGGLNADLWKTDPVLGTSISRKRYQGAV